MNPLTVIEAIRLGILTWGQIQQIRLAGLFTPEQWQALDDEYQRRIGLADGQAQPGATPTRDGSDGPGGLIDA